MGGSQGWSSAGLFHEARVQLHRFLAASGGYVDQVMNYSFGAALAFLPHIVGSPQSVVGPLTSWSSIARHSRLMVLFGGANPKNTLVSKGGCASHSTSGWIAELASAGVEVINISPIREDGPDAVRPEWIPIRPNTDTAMLLALTHTLVSEGLHDQAFLDKFCVGFERVLPYLMGGCYFAAENAEWAAPITGVPADTIRALARRMAATRTMVTASWVLQRAHHGEQPYWAVILLASALGQIGLPGGGFGFGYGSGAGIGDAPLSFAAPAMDSIKNPLRRDDPFTAGASQICSAASKEMDDFRQRQARQLSRHQAGLLGRRQSVPSSGYQCSSRAWRGSDTVGETSRGGPGDQKRHAGDCKLPGNHWLERNDIGGARRDKFIIAMQQAVAPVGEARNDFAIFSDLAKRLGIAETYTQGRDENAWLRHLYEQCRHSAGANAAALPDFDTFWQTGYLEIPAASEEYVIFGDFRADPETAAAPSGKIELYSEKIAGFGYDDCPPHPTWIEPWEWLGGKDAKTYPLHLVSSQPRDRLHSQMDCGPVSAGGKVAGREAITINPADAKARGIGDGDVVRVHNSRGACLAGAIVSDTVSAGGEAVLRRLVRSGRRRRAGALPARQRERADARSGHLEARAGAKLRHRAGRGRALYGAAASRSPPSIRRGLSRPKPRAFVNIGRSPRKLKSLPAGRHHADRRRGPARAEAAAVIAAAIKSRPAPAVADVAVMPVAPLRADGVRGRGPAGR